MGIGLLSQLDSLDSFDVVGVVNRDVSRTAKRFLSITGRSKEEIVLVSNQKIEGFDSLDPEDFNTADQNDLTGNKTVIADDLELLKYFVSADVVIDLTGDPEAGARIALYTVAAKNHLVTFNVELDITVGPMLKKLYENSSRVYTLSAGDEPAALKELYDFADGAGFRVIAAGKGKNNPLDRHADPESVYDYARTKGSSPRMMTSFVDGTKSMIEMACLSNATGLMPDKRGMHGPKVNIDNLLDVFCLKSEGGILGKEGVVDYAIGDLAPGVFLIYSTDNKFLREELEYLLFGKGPNYLIYRPYHLTSMETPLSIARVFFYNEPTIIPKNELISEVITFAKKDLKKGIKIDGIGGYTVYGLIDSRISAKKDKLLPIGLSSGLTLKNDISQDQPISLGDVYLHKDSLLYGLWAMQEKIFR